MLEPLDRKREINMVDQQNTDETQADRDAEKKRQQEIYAATRKLIGIKLSEEIKFRKLKYREIAEKGGVTKDNVSDAVNCRTNDIETLLGVCRGIGVSLSVIIGRAELDIEARLREIEQGFVDKLLF